MPLMAAVNGVDCTVPSEPPPILVTYYDVAFCYDEGGNVIENINCDSDPGHFADGTAVLPESYGRVAACIPEWLGRTVVIEGVGEWLCRDTGGAIEVVWNDYYEQVVIHVDVLAHSPPSYNYWLFSEWHLSN